MANKKFYCVLDCETATHPEFKAITENASLIKPLIYDIAWKIVDRQGVEYEKESFIVSEIFYDSQVFDSAYYAEKKPIYLKKIREGKITVSTWDIIIKKFNSQLEKYNTQSEIITTAYNAFFDFKKAIPFTEKYMNALHSDNFRKWLDGQVWHLKQISEEKRKDKSASANKPDNTLIEIPGGVWQVSDLWGATCETLINTKAYKKFCLANNFQTASGRYFITNAEVVTRYFRQDINFIEEHTALEDVEIETEILIRILKKGALKLGIQAFPFRTLGTVKKFMENEKLSTRISLLEEIKKIGIERLLDE